MTTSVRISGARDAYTVRGPWRIEPESLIVAEGRPADPGLPGAVPVVVFLSAEERNRWSSNPEFRRRSELKQTLLKRFDNLRSTDAAVGGLKTRQADMDLRQASQAFANSPVGWAGMGERGSEAEQIIAMIVSDWLMCYHYALFTAGDQPSMLRDFYRVAVAGLCPIVWRGPWPHGFCVAYCPPAHPWAHSGVPAAWRPSSADQKVGKTKPKHLRPLALPVPDEPVAPTSAWRDLAAQRDPSEALAGWLESWAETPACLEVLRALAARIERIEPTATALRLHARASEYQSHLIELGAPFTGALAPMPGSAARLIRRHNGVAFFRPAAFGEVERVVLSPRYTKGRFPAEFEAWWQADPWDPEEPFIKPPLVPCMDQDLWVYHPHRLRAPGELELRRIDHEGGDLRAALPYGAGGVILRLLAEQLVPSISDQRGDFDLRLDTVAEDS